MLDKGDVKEAKQAETEQAVRDMMTYFFIGVRLPNSSFWVNLRPDSPERIIDARLAQTDIGRIMLAADVQLKKDLAAYTSPKTKEGKAYWDKLYKKAEELFGSEDISIPTMTRPWIVPDEIILRDAGTSAYIYKATLKVLLEADHLRNGPAIQSADPRIKTLNDYSSQIIKESILPKLSKDVNISRRYAPLRQVYYSLILAQWFKSRNMGIDKSIDQKDLAGLMSNTAWDKGVYFKQYQDSFQKGEYDLQETVRTPFGQTIRQYFSGGIQLGVQNKEAPTPSVLSIAADGGIRLSAVKGSERALVTAHDKGFTIQLLHDDIAQGVQDGDIVMPHGPLRDDYSMFQQGLDWTNTRIQAETPVYLLKAFMDIYEQCRIMVLGPGAGTELSHIDDIAQEQGRQVEVDTISLSPLPLRFRLELDSANLWEQVKAYTKAGFSLAGLEEYYALLSDREIGDITRINRAEFNRALRHGEHEKIPMSVIPPLQNAGFHIYSRLPTPHIHRQYIMPLTDILSGGFGIQKRYHIVLDNHGGFYYTVMTEGLDEAVRAVDMLLAPDGVFYARVVPWMKEELDEFEFPGLVIFVTSEELLRKRIEEPLRTLIVRKDSLHMRRLAGCSGVRQVSDGMYRVDNMDKFVKKFIPAKSGAAIRKGLSTVVADNNPSHGAPVPLPSHARSHKDGGTLSIPHTAFNFADQLPLGWQSSMRREYYDHQEHRQLAQDHMEALSQFGIQLQMKMANTFPARAESVGPVALNPACGGDVMLFGLRAITDIIGIDVQPFGPPARIIAPQRTVNPSIKARYYAMGTDAMETLMALPETGNLIVERILIGLNAAVTGIYYFTLNDAGKMSFIESPGMKGTVGFGNAVVEFKDENGLTKRYWYIRQDLNRRSKALRSFLEQTTFQSLVLKGAFDMFNPDSPLFPDHDNLIQTILEPARRHSAWVIHDESRDGNPYKMWQEQFKPYHVQRTPVRLRSGMIVKPFFGLSEKNVFWGPADYLKTSSHQRHRGEYYEIFCREMSRINPDKTDIDYQLEFDRWMFRHYRLIVPEPGPDDSMVFADMLKHPPEPESLNDTELYLAFQNAFWSRAFTQLKWDFYLFGHFGFGQYPKILHKLLEPEAKAAIKQDRELLKLYYKSGAQAFRRIAQIEASLADEMFARFAKRPEAVRKIVEYLHDRNIPILDSVLNRLLGIRDYELEETLSPGIESSAAYQSEDHFYQGTPYEFIRQILRHVEPTSSDVLVDLGSGYGRMVIYAALATRIKKAIGIELVAERASVSSRTAEELGLANVEFQNSHVKDADIQDGTVFYLFNPFSDETFALAMDKLREVARTRKITMIFWQCNEAELARCTWMKLVKTVPYRSYTAYIYEADPLLAKEVDARQARQRDGGNTDVFISDPDQVATLRDVCEVIERSVQGNSLPGDPVVISSGRGSESAVYRVAGYDRVVFKVMDEDLSEYRFNIQTDNLSRIAGANGYTRVPFDKFDLVSIAHIAPFAYCSLQNASGKRIRMVVQQKAVMPLERDELDALKADLKRAGITWVDAGPRNAAMIESEHGGQTTRMPVVIDLGGLFFKDATAQLIEMLFNAPEADDRHSAASALWAQDPERVPVQVMDALKKASNSEKDPFARSVIKAILRSASMGQDSAQSQQNFYTQPRQDGKHIFELWQEKADVGSSITPAVYDDGYRANMVRLIKSVTRENKDAAILSIGSGIAFVEEILASDGYRNITAVDIHREAAEIARSKGLESFVATGESLPIGSSSQDVVYLDGALGHMAASFKAPYDNCFQQPLREVSRVLKDTGLVVISDDVPAEGSDYELNPRVELLRVSDTVIAQELKNAGFKVFDIQFFSYLRPGIGEVKRRVVVAQKADFAPQDVAGIDFIGLQAAQTQSMAGPLSARILTCLGQSVPVPISADLSQEWLKIEQAINAGTIPAVSSMEGYVKACCQSERIAAERNKVLLALAAILRLQEDLYIPTEPRLKELLVLLESPV
ncbi:MAG: class I SAM-dependent methyltransferase [Candidatus Omnitrophica bacterium]|nr:class I SAM-dependent methyltransferase [Candidatus Omnitrophota bacterium]